MIAFLRRLLTYLSASLGGVREDRNPLAFWRHVRPSPADVARTDNLLTALSDAAVSDPDGFDRVVFLAYAGQKAGA